MIALYRIGRKLGGILVLGSAIATGGGCEPTESGESIDTTVASIDAEVPADFVPHKARGVAVSLKAPPAWQPTSTSGTVVLNLRTGEPRSSVNVVVVPAEPGESIDKTIAKLPEDLAREFANFKLLRRDVLILHDLPAGRLVYEASRGGFHGKLMQVVITKAGTHYIFTYTATPERYESEAATVEQVLASLEVP